MDIAYVLAALPGRENEPRCKEVFLKGYDSVKELPPRCAEHMSLFERYRCVLQFYRIVRSLKGSDTLVGPPWLPGLRGAFIWDEQRFATFFCRVILGEVVLSAR